MSGCSTSENDFLTVDDSITQINLPKTSVDHGKAVAKEIRKIVYNLNEAGYDFPVITDNTGVTQFYDKAYEASSIPISQLSSKSIPGDDLINIQTSNNALTDAQRNIINEIIRRYGERKSDDEFKKRLISINRNIYKIVPKIEQERLFNIISVIYYGLAEIQFLEKSGALIRYNIGNDISLSRKRLKSFSEDGEGGTTICREEQSAFAIAIGIINSAGEKVTNVFRVGSVAVGVLGAFIVTWCMNREMDNQNYCVSFAQECVSNPWKDGIRMDCQACLQHCLRNHEWRCPVYD